MTSGGRVFSVAAYADTLESALRLAYDAVRTIEFRGMFYRKNIGARHVRLKDVFLPSK